MLQEGIINTEFWEYLFYVYMHYLPILLSFIIIFPVRKKICKAEHKQEIDLLNFESPFQVRDSVWTLLRFEQN